MINAKLFAIGFMCMVVGSLLAGWTTRGPRNLLDRAGEGLFRIGVLLMAGVAVVGIWRV